MARRGRRIGRRMGRHAGKFHHRHHHHRTKREPPKQRFPVETAPAAPAGRGHLPADTGAQWRDQTGINQDEEVGSFSVGPLQFRRGGPARPPEVPPGGAWQHARFENHLKMAVKLTHLGEGESLPIPFSWEAVNIGGGPAGDIGLRLSDMPAPPALIPARPDEEPTTPAMHQSSFFTMQLKEITGNIVQIPDVHLSDTIAQVKLKVHQQNEMHPDSQRLILGDAVLDDHTKTLAGCGVTEETVVMLQAQDPEATARRRAQRIEEERLATNSEGVGPHRAFVITSIEEGSAAATHNSAVVEKLFSRGRPLLWDAVDARGESLLGGARTATQAMDALVSAKRPFEVHIAIEQSTTNAPPTKVPAATAKDAQDQPLLCFRGHPLMPVPSAKGPGCAYEHQCATEGFYMECARCERELSAREPFIHCPGCYVDVCVKCAETFSPFQGRKETDKLEATFRPLQFDHFQGLGADQFCVCMPTKDTGGIRIQHSDMEANVLECVAPVESLPFIDLLQTVEEWGYHFIRNQASSSDAEDDPWTSFKDRHEVLFNCVFVTALTVNGTRFCVDRSAHKTGSWDTTGDGRKNIRDYDVTGDGKANVRIKGGDESRDHELDVLEAVAFWPPEARALRLSPTDSIEFEATSMVVFKKKGGERGGCSCCAVM